MGLPQMQEPYDDDDETPELRRLEHRTENARVAWWWLWIVVIGLVIWWAAWGWGGSGGWLWGMHSVHHGAAPGATGGATPGGAERAPSNGNAPQNDEGSGASPNR